MTHVISGNNYHGFTGTDHVAAGQSQLTGEVRSLGEIQVGDVSSRVPFAPTNTAHVDASADRVSMLNEQFQFIERIATSQGANRFYFGNDWGPSSALASIAGALGGSAAALLAPNSDRTLEIDTSAATDLVIDFRQVTDELRFEFTTEADGSTSLTVSKTNGFDIPLLNMDLVDAGEMQHNAIRFTKVDQQTTIYGGREVNTFALQGDATFDGQLIGGEGYRDWVSQLIAGTGGGSLTGIDMLTTIVDQLSNINSLLGGNLPEIFVTNVIDNTDAAVTVIEGDSLWEKATSGLSNLFFDASLVESNDAISITQTSGGDALSEVQSVYLTDPALTSSVEFTFNGTAPVTWTTGSTLTTADLAPIPVSSVSGNGTEADPWLFSFNGDAPAISVVAKDVGNANIDDGAVVTVTQDGTRRLGEIQGFVAPDFTFQLNFGGESTRGILPTASADEVALALRELTSLGPVERERLFVTGAGTASDPWLVHFAEPGDRALMTLEPAVLDLVQPPTAENDVAKFTLSLDAAISGTGTFGFGASTSGLLGAVTSSDEVAAAVADVLGLTVDDVQVEAIDPASTLFEFASRFNVVVANPPANVDTLSFDSSQFLLKSFDPFFDVRAGADYQSPAPAPQDVQVIRSLLTTGTFLIQHEDNSSADINFNASASDVNDELESLLGRTDFNVTKSSVQGTSTWTITFDIGAANTPELSVSTATEQSQSATGFNGSLKNITAVTYGAGINRITGSESSIDAATSVADLGNSNSANVTFDEFVQALFGNGTRPGDDTFEVGGNLIQKAKDWLAEQQGHGAEDSPSLNKLADIALGAWFGSTISPGIHSLSGLSGSDTYRFGGIFGAAAVLEPNSENAAERNFMDTLDLSAMDYDVTIDVYHAALQDIDGYSDLLYALGGLITDLPPADEVAEIMVIRDNSISEQLSSLTLGAVDTADIFGDALGNVILAFDIENLVLGEGETTIRFHGDARIHGIVSGSEDGTIVLDYSEPSLDPDADIAAGAPFDLQVDGEGGIQWELIPPIEITPSWQVGGLTIDPITYPGISIEFASASRVDGNRLLGRDAFYSLMDSWGIPNTDVIFTAIANQAALDNWSSDNAITNVDGVVLPTANMIADVDNGRANVGSVAWHNIIPTTNHVALSINGDDDLEIEMKADAGVWQLAYLSGSNRTIPLAANITAAQLQDALNTLPTGPGDFTVTGTGAADDKWVVSRPTALSLAQFARFVDNIELQPGITSGLYRPAAQCQRW